MSESKKVKTTQEVTKEAVTTLAIQTIALDEAFTSYPHATIRKLAEVAEVNYQMLLKRSKDPIKGVPYDPEALNFQSMQHYLAKQLIDVGELDWEAINTPRASRATHASSKDINDPMFDVGNKVYLRTNKTTPYTILIKTATHIVIMLDGTEEPISWNHNTFFFKGPKSEPRTAE